MVVAVRVRQLRVKAHDGHVIVDEVLQGIGQERPEPIPGGVGVLLGLHGVAEHARFGGEPGPPADHVQNRGDDHDGKEGGQSVEESGPEKGTAHAETAASKVINRNNHHPEEGHVVQTIPLHRKRQAQRHARGEAPPAIAHARAEGEIVDPVSGPDVLEAGLHLLGIPHREVSRQAHQEHLEVVQHGRAPRDEEDPVAQGNNAGE